MQRLPLPHGRLVRTFYGTSVQISMVKLGITNFSVQLATSCYTFKIKLADNNKKHINIVEIIALWLGLGKNPGLKKLFLLCLILFYFLPEMITFRLDPLPMTSNPISVHLDWCPSGFKLMSLFRVQLWSFVAFHSPISLSSSPFFLSSLCQLPDKT